MAISGHPDLVYNIDAHHHAIETIHGTKIQDLFVFFYPPYVLLLFLPLSLIPYYWSFCLWLGAGLLLYILLINKIFRNRTILGLAIGCPGIFLNLYWGQNAFITTILILGFIYYVDRNALLAGVFLGLLFYKPQFAVFCLIAVMANRNWKCLAATLSVLGVLVAGSLLAWGPSLWISYYPLAGKCAELSLLSIWDKTSAIQPTVYSFLRLLGIGINTALISQYAISLAMAIIIYIVWRRRTKGEFLSVIILGYCILLGLPYYIQYDMLLVIIPIIYYMQYFYEVNGSTIEKLIMSIMWVLPILGWVFVLATRLQIAPVIYAIGLIISLKKFNKNRLKPVSVNR